MRGHRLDSIAAAHEKCGQSLHFSQHTDTHQLYDVFQEVSLACGHTLETVVVNIDNMHMKVIYAPLISWAFLDLMREPTIRRLVVYIQPHQSRAQTESFLDNLIREGSDGLEER